MQWFTVAYTAAQISTGLPEKHRAMFAEIARKAFHEGVALLGNQPEAGPQTVHYYTPQAAHRFSGWVRFVGGFPCERPEKATFLVGAEETRQAFLLGKV